MREPFLTPEPWLSGSRNCVVKEAIQEPPGTPKHPSLPESKGLVVTVLLGEQNLQRAPEGLCF